MPRAGPTRHHLGSRRAEVAGMVVRVKVNGNWREAEAWPGASLLTFLRDRLGLYGSKNACEQGECGSCSVWLDGTLVCSCLVLAAQAHEREVRTVESLIDRDKLHPIQEAFLEAVAVEGGVSTPGCLTVREALSENICRCTGYQKIVDAAELPAARLRAGA